MEETTPLLSEDIESATDSSYGSETSSSNGELKIEKQEKLPCWKSFVGILMVIFAGFAFTASNVLQKFIVPTLTFWQLLLHRAIAQTILLLIVTSWEGRRCNRSVVDTLVGPPNARIRTVLQGFLGGILLLCMFTAIKHVPLGNASAIMFCTPIFTFILAPFMLKEPCGLYRTLISMLMISGVIMITRPPVIFGPDPSPAKHHHGPNVTLMAPLDGNRTLHDHSGEVSTLVGYCCAIGVPLLSAVISIITRQCKHVPVHLLMFWFGLGGAVVSGIGVAVFKPHHLFDLSRLEWTTTAAIIFLGILGNLSYTFAVKWVSPSKANVFRSFEVILNFLLQLHFEHTVFHSENAVGIGFLLLAVVIMGYEKEAMQRFSHIRFL